MERLDLTTPNFTDENIQKLSELFPNCVTEDSNGKAIDFDALKQELSSNIIEGNKERYQLTWPGKAKSLVTANMPINKTLRPVRAESKDFDNTENLYIEGDNLEVLKLLQETYLGKVKMIYIDPPYNTGKDFVYKDDFTQDKAEYDAESGNIDDEGGRLVSNPDSNGRYHSDWLSMMYPRLKLARNLLKDDGVLFISIDNTEIINLNKVCNEIFSNDLVEFYTWYLNDSSEGSFVKTPSHTVRQETEYIVACFKGKKKLSKYPEYRYLDRDDFTNADNDPRGNWMSGNISRNGITSTTGSKYFTITTPTGAEYTRNWTVSHQEFKDLVEDGRIYFSNNGDGVPRLKIFQNEPLDTTQSSLLQNLRSSSTGKKEVSDLFGVELFSFPKPTNLISRLSVLSDTSNEIVLDFFSGSATTAHAIMQLNAEDGGNRKFIMAQIPEATDEKSEAYKAGYKTIAEIGKERIRRAGEKIKEDNADKEGISDLDIGFRVLKVDSSNMKDVYFSPDNTSQDDMFDLASNIKDDRADEDLLFMVLLDWGIDLSVKIERREVAGKTVYFADDNFLAACFNDDLNEDFIKALASENPLKVVLRDSGFASSSVKINVEQIFKQADIEVKVI